MFNVNIDKLVEMDAREKSQYAEICNNVLAKGRKYKTIAVLYDALFAFKLAETIMEAKNTVLFIDADYSNSIFLSKYKLGKDLKGVCEFLDGTQKPADIICSTSKGDLDIVFTGDPEKRKRLLGEDASFRRLLDTYCEQYEYVIISTPSTEVARLCDGTIDIMENDNYSERKAKKEVSKLDSDGCKVMGVIVAD